MLPLTVLASALLAVASALPPSLQSTIAIPYTSTQWKYLDSYVCNAAAPSSPASWALQSFAATGWLSGTAPLGYPSTNGVTTTIASTDTNPKMRGLQRAPTVYFRHLVTVSSVSTLVSADLSIIRDDAVVVYVNGVEGKELCARPHASLAALLWQFCSVGCPGGATCGSGSHVRGAWMVAVGVMRT